MPTTVTGMVRPSMSSVRFASCRLNSGRKALAIGTTKCSKLSLIRSASPGPGGRRSERQTACWKRWLPELELKTSWVKVVSAATAVKGSFPARTKRRAMASVCQTAGPVRVTTTDAQARTEGSRLTGALSGRRWIHEICSARHIVWYPFAGLEREATTS